jgi:pyruvate/2-oxoglutarate dehydrogenase complex dihydrolipoamide dehydrogenase (E3) component
VHHDLIIIGTGSGNMAVDDSFADLRSLRWTALRDRVFGRTNSESAAGRKHREDGDFTTFYEGHAEFAGPLALRIEDRDGEITELTADQIVVANGLGAVSSPVPLKFVANREADVVKHNLRHPDDLRAVSHELVPSAVFASPQIASIGLTEEKCRQDHPGYLVGRKPYSGVAYGWAMQDDSGFCKVLVDGKNDKILGAHIMGPQAASIIGIFVVAMEFGITAKDLAMRPYWIHPALTEVVQNALLDVKAAA